QRFLEGLPITARPVGRLERTWRWCRRNPAAAIAGLALLAVAVASVILAVKETQHAGELAEKQKQTKDALERRDERLAELTAERARLARSFLDTSMREYARRNLAESLNWMLLACEQAPANDPLRVSYRRLLAGHAQAAEKLL